MRVNRFGGGKYSKTPRANYARNKRFDRAETLKPIEKIGKYISNNSVFNEIIPKVETIPERQLIKPIASDRELIKPIMDPQEYIAREHRTGFDFDNFKTKYADVPIRDIQNMVNNIDAPSIEGFIILIYRVFFTPSKNTTSEINYYQKIRDYF